MEVIGIKQPNTSRTGLHRGPNPTPLSPHHPPSRKQTGTKEQAATGYLAKSD